MNEKSKYFSYACVLQVGIRRSKPLQPLAFLRAPVLAAVPGATFHTWRVLTHLPRPLDLDDVHTPFGS